MSLSSAGTFGSVAVAASRLMCEAMQSCARRLRALRSNRSGPATAALVVALLLAACGGAQRAASSGSLMPRTSPPQATIAAAPQVTSVVAVSCPSPRDCFAGGTTRRGDVMLNTANGGATWHGKQEAVAVSAIDCPSPTVCVGGGLGDEVLTTTDGGRTWIVHTVSSRLAEVQAVSCPTASDCWATALGKTGGGIDVLVYHSADGGISWIRVTTPELIVPMGNLSGIDCVTRSDCIVTGYGVLGTRNGGASWTKVTLKNLVLDSVTCTSASDCIALSNVPSGIPSHESGSIYTTTDAGKIWAHRLTGREVTDLDGISCASASRCVSAGAGYTSAGKSRYTFWGAIETTQNGGTAWKQRQDVSVSYLLDVACAMHSPDCIGVGVKDDSGAILKSTDYGAIWTPVRAPQLK